MVLGFGGFLGGDRCSPSVVALARWRRTEKGNGERGKECSVGTVFTYERSPTTWRSWHGMNTTRWLSSEPVGHDVRLNVLKPTESELC
jgi:hypothetical protein